MDSSVLVHTYEYDVLKILLAAGASVNYFEPNSDTIINRDLNKDDAKLLKILLDANTKFNDLEIAYHLDIAISNDLEEILKVFIDARVNLNTFGHDGRTPLANAIRLKKQKAIDLLLAAGADPNMKTSNPRHMLLIACEDGDVDTVKTLVGSLVSMIRERDTALRYAVWNNHAEIVKILLENGSCLFEDNPFDDTPLQIASENGHTDIVKILLEAGAHKEKYENGGVVALALAENIETAQALIDIGVKDFVYPLSKALSRNNHAFAEFLLSKGADPNAKNKHGTTSLMLSTENGDVDAVRFLLDIGTDPNITNDEGDTALIMASEHHYVEIVKLLLEAGADPNIINMYECTALIMAYENEEITEILLKAGAVEYE